jgi:hypothetical protein
MIPRLAILEIEQAANRANSDRDKSRKNLITSAVSEIQFLKQNGAQFLAELEKETFEAFSRIAKDQKTDSWIRREIREQIRKETIGKDSNKIKKVTMFTSDVINATAAIAENIDTIFISRIDYEKTSTRVVISYR